MTDLEKAARMALDDFMDKQTLDDLIDFVCAEYTSPQRKPLAVQGVSNESQNTSKTVAKTPLGKRTQR
jgi:hypothetical protein